jgi:hypothetical protein
LCKIRDKTTYLTWIKRFWLTMKFENGIRNPELAYAPLRVTLKCYQGNPDTMVCLGTLAQKFYFKQLAA